MKLTFLGTGTSCGVPVLGCQCKVCTSSDPHDRRLRCSALLETESTRVLIDCGPDFREQMLRQPYRKIDGVVLTHIHYDHVGGIDDLRPYCKFGDIHIYCDERVNSGLHHNIPYCFAEHLYPGVPHLHLHTIEPHHSFMIGDIPVMPIQVMHGQMPILGYRFGSLAYITDMKTIDDGELKYLEGVDTLVVNALRFEKPHHSHMLVGEALEFIHHVGCRRAYLIHSCHHIGLHAEVNKLLPKGVEMAYDGQVVQILQ